VKTLDKFTEYITELENELLLRNKQYNYYRDMLLSEEFFKNNNLGANNIDNYEIKRTTLGEIGKFIRGNGLLKKDLALESKPVIHYGQIYTKYGFETYKTFSFTSQEVFDKLRKAKKNDILIATTSENIKDVCKSVVWLGEEQIGFSGDMYCYRTSQNSKYIAYFLQSKHFQMQKERKVSGVKMIRLHSSEMEKFTITLPPLSIQDKIVEILDQFNTLTSNLTQGLPKEIELRQKQYEYYREQLLSFNGNKG
ncbi:restriction endonuclease subunit S, partial [Ureaplasma diversum]|uniref:restriction endonuclease subunit S n=1 Tax=Ureaplasma diversum TaxID=42094 RepID=UPI001E498A70